MKGNEHFYRTAVLFWYHFFVWRSWYHAALVEPLTLRTKAWEEEQWGRFMFDGVTVFHHQFSELQKSVFIDLWCSHSMLQLTGYLLISHWMLNTGETACHAGWVQLLVLRKRWGEALTQGMYQIPHYFWTSDISVIYLFCIPQVSCLGKPRSS
jgi:hypothetical protein